MQIKILVVDDSATDRLIIKNLLTDYDVLTASNGSEAIRLIDENEDIKLIILDLMMPGNDGFQVLERLRSGKYKSRKIRTIILTNHLTGISLGT